MQSYSVLDIEDIVALANAEFTKARQYVFKIL